MAQQRDVRMQGLFRRRPSGTTTLVGLIGSDIRGSLSLRLHNEAYAASDMDWLYLPLTVPAEPPTRLREAVHGLRALGFVGANVTMPHKVAVLPYLDDLTDKARKIGAVNTIRVEHDGRLIGGNTDGAGFLADLGEQDVDCQRQPALVLGAGGAARAVAYTLAEHGCPAITIVNRTESKARQLVHELSLLFPDLEITAQPWASRVDEARYNSLLINCTNVGMNGVCTPSGSPSPWPSDAPLCQTQRIIDLVYTPRATPLLQRAMQEGLQTISGVGMLVHQAALSFAWWAESSPPIEAMHAAVAAPANLR